MSAPPGPLRRQAKRLGAFFGALALVVTVPFAELARATRAAEACVAERELPTGRAGVSCAPLAARFDWLARVPWTEVEASHRAEELFVRDAVSHYLDARAGQPSADAVRRAGHELTAAERRVRLGSKRLVQEELGPAIGAPELGR